MTDRPTSTNPSAAAPDESTSSRRTAQPDDSELTRRAREVIAGSDGNGYPFSHNASGGTITRMAEYIACNGGDLAPMGEYTLTNAALVDGGLVEPSIGIGSVRGWGRLTDLGREVARLLALEVGRG